MIDLEPGQKDRGESVATKSRDTCVQDGIGPCVGQGMISIVVPLYNEEESIPVLYEELCDTVGRMGRPYELVFVNDGSTDQTGAVVDRLTRDDPHVSVIHFRKNYGQTAAMAAGIDHSRGEILSDEQC